jgi:hypothetical protein
MKTKSGVIIIMLLIGLIIGASLPDRLYAGGGTSEGFLWDPFINQTPLSGIVYMMNGTLSISYDVGQASASCGGQYVANMFYTVRLSKDSKTYTFNGSTDGVCTGDIGVPGSGGQGDAIMNFLGTAVRAIFPNAKNPKWNLVSVSTPWISPVSDAFVADIFIEALKK